MIIDYESKRVPGWVSGLVKVGAALVLLGAVGPHFIPNAKDGENQSASTAAVEALTASEWKELVGTFGPLYEGGDFQLRKIANTDNTFQIHNIANSPSWLGVDTTGTSSHKLISPFPSAVSVEDVHEARGTYGWSIMLRLDDKTTKKTIAKLRVVHAVPVKGLKKDDVILPGYHFADEVTDMSKITWVYPHVHWAAQVFDKSVPAGRIMPIQVLLAKQNQPILDKTGVKYGADGYAPPQSVFSYLNDVIK